MLLFLLLLVWLPGSLHACETVYYFSLCVYLKEALAGKPFNSGSVFSAVTQQKKKLEGNLKKANEVKIKETLNRA